MTDDNIDSFDHIIKKIAMHCKKYNILLCIESNVKADKLLAFIERIDLDNLGVVYDIGNRIAFNDINIEDELRILEKRVFHIHIKDKNISNENVFLGTGLVNFRSFFKLIKELDYRGKYVFESVRGNNPIKTLLHNINFCEFFLKER